MDSGPAILQSIPVARYTLETKKERMSLGPAMTAEKEAVPFIEPRKFGFNLDLRTGVGSSSGRVPYHQALLCRGDLEDAADKSPPEHVTTTSRRGVHIRHRNYHELTLLRTHRYPKYLTQEPM